MIPKIIHYCWFGGKEMPELERKCFATWQKVLPDYEFKLWNEDSFDINSCNWTKQAYEAGKFAFVSDYVRLKVLYEFGGVYLDTDIKMYKSFDNLLNLNGFMCFDSTAASLLCTALIASVPRHNYIRECLNYYDRNFSVDSIVNSNLSNAYDMTDILVKYGLALCNKKQEIGGMTIFPNCFFCPMDYFSNWNKTENTYCVHLFSGSWLSGEEKEKLEARRKLWWRMGKTIYVRLKSVPLIKALRDWMKRNKIID